MSDLAVVFQIGSLGDSIVSLPTLLSLKELLPSVSDYTLVTKVESDAKVAVNEVFDMAWKAKGQITFQRSGPMLRQLASFAGLVAKLRYHRPRYCVYLAPADRSPEQVKRDELFFRAGGVRNLIGFRAFRDTELNSAPFPNFRNSEAYLRFLRVWNRPAEDEFHRYARTPLFGPDESATQSACRWLERERRYPGRRLVALCPYSNWSSRDMPRRVIAEVLWQLERRLNLEVVLMGGQKDASQAESVSQETGAGLNACGTFSLGESAALMQQCGLAICTESGPMHLAGALSVPSVVVFGRTNKHLGRWFPLGDNHTILYREAECAGCNSMDCKVSGHPCMSEITSEQIVAAAICRLDGLWLSPRILDRTQSLVS